MDVSLEAARDADVPAVVALMNQAYRGTGAEAGWTTETHYIVGDRTSERALRADIAERPDAALLVWRASEGIRGCVWLEPAGDAVWYLGSLTVESGLQNAGLGRQLLAAAEEWVRQRGGREITMTVINVRETLIAWYGRRGYRATGQIEPFPYEDERFGVPQRDDLHFVVLQKRTL